MSVSKLHPAAFGITAAIMFGIPSIFAGLAAPLIFNGKPIAIAAGSMYITYIPTINAAIIGGTIIPLVAYSVGYVSSSIYNFLINKL